MKLKVFEQAGLYSDGYYTSQDGVEIVQGRDGNTVQRLRTGRNTLYDELSEGLSQHDRTLRHTRNDQGNKR